jgi:uncharacterized membrane protein
MALYDWLKLGHILGAMVWVGGGVMLVSAARRARASQDPASIGDFARSLAYLGPRVLAPSVIAVLVFGVWMVLDSSAWDFGQAWVLAAIGLFGLTFVVGAVYLSRVALRLVRATATDDPTARELLDRWIATYAIVIVLLVITVWDMVFKPGA